MRTNHVHARVELLDVGSRSICLESMYNHLLDEWALLFAAHGLVEALNSSFCVGDETVLQFWSPVGYFTTTSELVRY